MLPPRTASSPTIAAATTQFRHSLRIRFAIIVHQPHVSARKGEAGAHSSVKAAGAAGVLFQANWVKRAIAMRRLGGQQSPRPLIGSVVDDHKVARRESLRINRGETSFEQRRTVPRYDDCGYSYHEGASLTYEMVPVILLPHRRGRDDPRNGGRRMSAKAGSRADAAAWTQPSAWVCTQEIVLRSHRNGRSGARLI